MIRTRPGSPLIRRRHFAALLVLLGLVIQAMAPYLPMPATGGRTSWDLLGAALAQGEPAGEPAWLPICLSPRSGDQDGSKNPAPHPGDCAVCLVMQQAGATLAPDVPALALPAVVPRAMPALWQQAQRSTPIAEGFSSRAPPRLA